ncbi:hypothetical protein Gotri_018908, partial [Gossypium trilobum]|nr:hypothetical protein [Gossypium trilobum]
MYGYLSNMKISLSFVLGVDAWDTGLRSARFCPVLRKRDRMRFSIFCGTKG